jgi:hypothetical protein
MVMGDKEKREVSEPARQAEIKIRKTRIAARTN